MQGMGMPGPGGEPVRDDDEDYLKVRISKMCSSQATQSRAHRVHPHKRSVCQPRALSVRAYFPRLRPG